MEKVKYVDLVFENCEVARLSVENIQAMGFEIIKTFHSLVNGNEMFTEDIASNFYIRIKDLNKLYFTTLINKEEFILKRLDIPDITHIDIIYENGSNYYFATPWRGKSCYINKAQSLKKRQKDNIWELVVK